MNEDGWAQLELEVRQLDGVVLVAFERDGESTRLELTVDEGADVEEVMARAQRLAETQLIGPVSVTVLEDGSPLVEVTPRMRLRVQLLAVAPLAHDRVEIHLAYRSRRAVASCPVGDRVAVAEAVLEGLGELGLRVPFEATAVHLLSNELGDGAIVQLRQDGLLGTRRGLAGGRREEEAIARAVLNGLNRYLGEGSVRDELGAGGDDPQAGTPLQALSPELLSPRGGVEGRSAQVPAASRPA